jgi:hypothetical protein
VTFYNQESLISTAKRAYVSRLKIGQVQNVTITQYTWKIIKSDKLILD